jgi:hypothetical protein
MPPFKKTKNIQLLIRDQFTDSEGQKPDQEMPHFVPLTSVERKRVIQECVRFCKYGTLGDNRLWAVGFMPFVSEGYTSFTIPNTVGFLNLCETAVR